MATARETGGFRVTVTVTRAWQVAPPESQLGIRLHAADGILIFAPGDPGARRQAWMQEPVTSRGPSNRGADASTRKGASPFAPFSAEDPELFPSWSRSYLHL